MPYLDPVLIPSTHEESELVIDGREEKIVKKPYMVRIVDIETVMEFKRARFVGEDPDIPAKMSRSSIAKPENTGV